MGAAGKAELGCSVPRGLQVGSLNLILLILIPRLHPHPRQSRGHAQGSAEGRHAVRQAQILEDFLLVEDAPLLEMAEEDEELDLYNEMTFGLDQDSTEDTPKLLVPRKTSPVVAEETEVGDEPGPGAAEQPEKLGEPQEEGGTELEAEQVGSELEEEEEELGTEEQEPCEEPNDLGDPAVMRAVQSKPTLESQDSAVLDSRIGACWAEFDKEDMLMMDPGTWGSCPGSVSPHHVLEDKAILQVLKRPPSSTNMAFDFLGSCVQRGYGDSPRLKHPDLRLMSPKSFPQHFIQQQAPLMPPHSPCPPRPFPPARRPPPLFTSNQTSGYTSPAPFQPGSPTMDSPLQPLAMHFGPMSPSLDPALFFSPSANSQLNLSMPSHMTQLHPQHQRILTQRQQQGRQAQSISPKKPWSPKVDPHAGLMTSKEKDWVIKVEMIQLQSENMDDDYYYQWYYHRLERRQAEEELLGGRNKLDTPKLVTPFIQKVETYDSVVRIAGSLGQVAVSTCYSPRRAIDAVHHALVEEAAGSHRLRALHRIEKLFLQLLEVEEAQQKMSLALGVEQEQQSQEVESLYHALKIRACNSEEEAEDEFLQLLCVRKGKKLVARLLPHLTREQGEKILLTITHHLPFLMKKDVLDESLPLLYSPLNEVVGGMTFSKLIEVLQELTRPLPECPELPLTMALKNQFGISLLYSLLSHGERLLSSDVPLEPRSGDFEAWTDTVYVVARELSQVPKALLVEPLFLPSNLLSLFCRYLDKQTVHHLEAKMECSPLPSEAAMLC
ncbi:PREDICTED: protein PAT1 homolog 2 isoform X1 [Lepidothrix coronata]|uniref:Protein PAT1 homolog 2 isoform X1 n=2 Tax=Lepidothrix coronata TaxID=321398 RepID=A0A6J0HES1_9PASS|nr:PREDICTED: protein PAT1 homolog 2 isoform X1 [Lepidothrix coronata]